MDGFVKCRQPGALNSEKAGVWKVANAVIEEKSGRVSCFHFRYWILFSSLPEKSATHMLPIYHIMNCNLLNMLNVPIVFIFSKSKFYTQEKLQT